MSADDASTRGAVDTAAATEVAAGGLGSMASLLGEMAATRAPALLPGTLVAGQYRIERAVGAGAMGVVYRARDERLERIVAIKFGVARSARALAQLEREAAALARLSHGNVVGVYQVGVHDGGVFLAMEFVDGGTARAWVAARPREWRAIVALYTAAGAGLAAAHDAGLVHRDFKPDNVLVGDGDRPRVADFGLARAAAEDDGAIAGTPRYMPPEQRAGDAVDARADQYAFCVSLAEALAQGAPHARVPRHVTDALRRGHADDRDARWPSMAPLLEELARDPAARRRRVALVGGGAVALAAAAALVTMRVARDDAPPPCTDGPALVGATWNPARAARLATALGPRATPVVQALVDAYAQAWSAAHGDACRATRVDRSQTEDLLDRRMACLANARTGLDATLSGLELGGPEVAAGAATALGQLPELSLCADVTRLGRHQARPSDPEARAAVDAAEALVAAAEASMDAPQDRERVARAERALAAARATGWAPVLARALDAHANLIELAGEGEPAREAYREAAQLALASGHDDVAAIALADLAWNLTIAARYDEAVVALEVARGLVARGVGMAARRRVLSTAMSLATERARPAEAIAAARELAAMAAAVPGVSPVQLADDQNNLSIALGGAGDYGAAVTAAARAVALSEPALGPDHPEVGRYLVQLGLAQLATGDLDAAEGALGRGLGLLETWYGSSDPRLDSALANLGELRRLQGRSAEARSVWERRLAIARTALPALVTPIQSDLAILMIDLGDLDGAAAAMREVLPALEAQYGPDAMSALTDPLITAGHIARAQGRFDEAHAHIARSLALLERNVGAAHPAAMNARVELARTELVAGRPAAARATLEATLDAIAGRTDLPPTLVVESGLVFAEIELAQGRRAQARRRAAAAFAASTPATAPMVEAWRRAHPGL